MVRECIRERSYEPSAIIRCSAGLAIEKIGAIVIKVSDVFVALLREGWRRLMTRLATLTPASRRLAS